LVKDTHGMLPLSSDRHRRIVLVMDSERAGFVNQQKPIDIQLAQLLGDRGFEVREFDSRQPPTPADTDLVIYVVAQESLYTQANIYLDWRRMMGGADGAMRRYWHELSCVLVSFGHPYYLFDAPRMPCVVNAYSAIAPVQRAVVARLLGDEPFTGNSPVDALCGLPDAAY
jgi:beta-N-acetylhexosaminidase